MSTAEKLLNRLLSKPNDFTYKEACTLLGQLGYEKDNKGNTSGSRVMFYHPTTKRIFLLHSPHPGNELKRYVINDLINFLKENGEI